MRKTLLLLLGLLSISVVYSQKKTQGFQPDMIPHFFEKQLKAFPQEKLHVQTDRASYVSGEQIWFSAYLVNAHDLVPTNADSYVYAELINPLDSVVCHVKIKADSIGAFHGYLKLGEDLPEGDYTFRAYTQYMRNMDEGYTFKKAVRIFDPLTTTLNPQVEFSANDNIVNLHFLRKGFTAKILPSKVSVAINNGRYKVMNVDPDSVYRIPYKLGGEKRLLCLRVEEGGRIYNRYIQVPAQDKDFDVMFFPEGGNLPLGIDTKIAFKGINSSGQSELVSGDICDKDGNVVQTFSSEHNGMGVFILNAGMGEKYFAKCKNAAGVTKQFALPEAKWTCYSLSVNSVGDNAHISVLKSVDVSTPESLYLLVHTRGIVGYNEIVDPSKNYIVLPLSAFPSGIIHTILYNGRGDVLSERLLFRQNERDIANSNLSTNKQVYKAREKVSATIKLVDMDNKPLRGRLSIAVTDNKDVVPDSTVNILSSLLLTSDLRGHVESPASYFGPDKYSNNRLDLLMMTQGWRRYDIPKLIKGDIEEPTRFPVETNLDIEGKVDGALGRSVKKGEVALISTKDSSYTYITAVTDDKGRFYFDEMDYCDSTVFTLSATTKKGGESVFLEMKEKPSPLLASSTVFSNDEVIKSFVANSDYIDKAELKYIAENGIRTVNLADITITARAKPKSSSPHYSPFLSNGEITDEDIEEQGIKSMSMLWSRFSYTSIQHTPEGHKVFVKGKIPLFVVDGIEYSGNTFDVNTLSLSNIKEIFVLKDALQFGSRGANGVVVVTRKYGADGKDTPNVKRFTLLGYQSPAEFYSPKYETPQEKNSSIPDLRTTIHWQANISTSDNGMAIVSFYTADNPTTYTAIIEGVGDDGHLIHTVARVEVE